MGFLDRFRGATPPVTPADLTPLDRELGRENAAAAALRAQRSLTLTARKLYREYAEAHPGRALGWAEWHAAYERVYRRGIGTDGPTDMGAAGSGAAY